MRRILIGTSGWVYPHWRERFYPKTLPQSQWLAFFSQRFPTVEVNNTFYRLPTKSVFAGWRRQSAERFVFAVKGSRFITHIKRLRATARPVRTLLARSQGLEEKLGPILFQLPPRFGVNLHRLAEFLTILPPDRRFAFEFRDSSWHQRQVYDLLASRNVAYCIMVGPKLKREELATADFIYLRFHAPDADGPAFGLPRLRPWAETIEALTASGRDAYIYFNNDTQGAAIADAFLLGELLGT